MTDARVSSWGSVLAAAEAASPVDAVEAVTAELGMRLGAARVSFLIADLSGRALVRMAHIELADAEVPGDCERREGEESATVVPFDGGPAERAVRTQELQLVPPGGQGPQESEKWVVLAPVTERGEVIGVLELALPVEPDADTRTEISQLAHLLAYVVIASRRHTDLFEWGQRTRPLSMSAEVQQRLLPGPQTCEAGAFTLAGWLEPAADIAGDTFDFSLARDHLHLSLTDAMGHGVAAALAATLGVGGLRNARREGLYLREQVVATNRALCEHASAAGIEEFVTGLIGRLDLRAGSLDLVNAGHVAPFLARDGRVAILELPANVPLGLFPEATYDVTTITLVPGDRIVFLTDGMVERAAADVDLPAGILESRALHPREAVRALADRVLEATGGSLADDATVLCLDWHGDHGRDRDARHGADQDRASSGAGMAGD